MTKKTIVVDIDGTIADIEHRRHFVRSKPKNWPAFNRAMKNDTPHADIIWLVKVLAAQPDVTIIVASGRGDDYRDVTEQWLAEHGLGDTYVHLYMRKAKDSRSDVIVKAEILEEIRADYGEPYMVLDDRDGVVAGWRAAGIRCLQVAPGDF